MKVTFKVRHCPACSVPSDRDADLPALPGVAALRGPARFAVMLTATSRRLGPEATKVYHRCRADRPGMPQTPPLRSKPQQPWGPAFGATSDAHDHSKLAGMLTRSLDLNGQAKDLRRERVGRQAPEAHLFRYAANIYLRTEGPWEP